MQRVASPACLHDSKHFRFPESRVLERRLFHQHIAISMKGFMEWNGCCSVHVSNSTHGLFRKEVIQPQVLLRLPCYDFTPIMNHTLGRCSPCGSACGLLVQSTFVM